MCTIPILLLVRAVQQEVVQVESLILVVDLPQSIGVAEHVHPTEHVWVEIIIRLAIVVPEQHHHRGLAHVIVNNVHPVNIKQQNIIVYLIGPNT